MHVNVRKKIAGCRAMAGAMGPLTTLLQTPTWTLMARIFTLQFAPLVRPGLRCPNYDHVMHGVLCESDSCDI